MSRPYILQAYEQMGQPEQAAVFLSERAQAAIHEADFNRAATSLELAIQCAPEDVGLRVRFAEFAILADAGGNWIPKVFETVEWLIANERREEAGTVLRKILDAVPLTDEAAEKLSALFHEPGMQEVAIGLRVCVLPAPLRKRAIGSARFKSSRSSSAVHSENLTALELLAEAYQGAGNQSKAASQCTANLQRCAMRRGAILRMAVRARPATPKLLRKIRPSWAWRACGDAGEVGGVATCEHARRQRRSSRRWLTQRMGTKTRFERSSFIERGQFSYVPPTPDY